MHNNMQIGWFSGLMWLFQTAVLKSSPLTLQVSSTETCVNMWDVMFAEL